MIMANIKKLKDILHDCSSNLPAHRDIMLDTSMCDEKVWPSPCYDLISQVMDAGS